jgi:uncharacterized protein YyaL (SSP411 family)
MANRLASEDSPYLQQHKDNLVDWYPWCDEAFDRAKNENKLIFLSIGYSSCHWCHVMESESFNHEEIAEFLNKNYICIKVDKEERPDIDKHYQLVYQLMNKRAGGWPLSIFLNPEKKPFYSGTYFPPYENMGLVGFLELVKILHSKYEQNSQGIAHNANELERFISKIGAKKDSVMVNEKILDDYVRANIKDYESRYGGFSYAPKFPHHSTLSTLIDIAKLSKELKVQDMVTYTLKNMTKGGMYDLIDGGFCRYSVDEKWLVPHFEKMCYDNGLLIEVYLKAYFLTNDNYYKDIAVDTIDFMIDKMCEDYLFFSASDADTNHIEGEYFIYSYDEIKDVFEEENIDLEYLKMIGVTKSGNFDSKNIIRVEEEFGKFEEIRGVLKKLREKKEYPFIDKKIIVSQNAMMIKSLFVASRLDPKYKHFAIDTLNTLLNELYENGTLYHSKMLGSQNKIEAFLEDYSYLSSCALEAYKTTLDDDYLILAQQLVNSALVKFYDNGKWYFSKGDFDTLADSTDSTIPSAIACILDSMLTLSILLDDLKYKEFVFKSIIYYSSDIKNYPSAHSLFVRVIARYYMEDKVIKSKEKNLEELIYLVDKCNYPFVYLRANSSDNYSICKNTTCINNVDTIDMLDL